MRVDCGPLRQVCEDEGMDQQGTEQSCTGEWGPYNMEIVDMIEIDADLPAGKWVLNWRMDQEESNQIWQSCAGALPSVRGLCAGLCAPFLSRCRVPCV